MINSAYSYYLGQHTAVNNRKGTNYKRSELRDIYNSMVKINKNSPLYKIINNNSVHNHAIDIKEASVSLLNIAAKLDNDNDDNNAFSKKTAFSSNEDAIEVSCVEDGTINESSSSYSIIVDKLASEQINEGAFLPSHDKNLPVGSYSFDLNVGEYAYEFQFNVTPKDTNLSVQEKLTRLFNRSNVGIIAEVVHAETMHSALRLTSISTGLPNNRTELFSITNNEEDSVVDVVAHLGIGKITQVPSNAEFSINGIMQSSSTNTFTLNQEYNLTLKDITSKDEPVIIGLKDDLDSAIDNIEEFVSGYNALLDKSYAHSNGSFETNRLTRELHILTKEYRTDLLQTGINIEENGYLSVDRKTVDSAASEGNLIETLNNLNNFKDSLVNKASHININPMRYVDKKLIAYPNPYGSFAKPYITSVYSGMMFNGYI